MENKKTFKDKELKFIVDAFNEECRNFLYKQLAQHDEEAVWGILLVFFLNLYKESQAEEDRFVVEALMALMPDLSRETVASLIRPEYLRQYFDKELIVKILTNDFPSRYELDRKEKEIIENGRLHEQRRQERRLLREQRLGERRVWKARQDALMKELKHIDL